MPRRRSRRARFVALGIDAEENRPLPAGVLDMVATAEERAWLTEAGEDVAWDRLLFSAKESVFKAWYPLTGRWLGFDDAVLVVDLGRATFRARLLVEGPRLDGRTIDSLSGRFLVAKGFVVTAVAVPAC